MQQKICPQCRQSAPVEAQQCPYCRHLFQTQPGPTGSPQSSAEPWSQPTPTAEFGRSKKLAAGICGILLGVLGIHKFILGYKTEGLIMFLVSLVTFTVGGPVTSPVGLPGHHVAELILIPLAVLTSGVGAAAMALIGLIEGILYLTKSDEEFYRTYVVNKKGWF